MLQQNPKSRACINVYGILRHFFKLLAGWHICLLGMRILIESCQMDKSYLKGVFKPIPSVI